MERELPYRRLKSLRRKLMGEKVSRLREEVPEEKVERGKAGRRRRSEKGGPFNWRKLLEEMALEEDERLEGEE